MIRLTVRAAALLAAFVAAVTAVITPALAAAAPRPGPARAAAGWLARQMTGGSHFTSSYEGVSHPDQGLTIDAIYAFAAAGAARDYAGRAAGWLARPHILAGYIGNGRTQAYAGATANVLLAAEVAGADVRSFGGVNLPARLARLLTPSGRYSDHSKYGDYSNAFSQSLAIIATSRLGGAPRSAVAFLAGSECANGGFPLYFAQKTCASYPDATAMAVQALLAAHRWRPAERGLAWLARAQRPDGGFAAPPGKRPNANSTGLAGEAFAVAGWPARAHLARTFLLSVQVGCSGPPAERGAIAYDSTGFAKSTAVFATAQGILGLADVGLVQLTTSHSRPGAPRLACPS